jgi:AraC-like DNA-binding protein
LNQSIMLMRLYETIAIPIGLVDAQGHIKLSCPALETSLVPTYTVQAVLQDFALQGRDAAHPMVIMMEPGYFIGIAQLGETQYLIMGPASPLAVSQKDQLRFCENAVYTDKILEFCNILNQTPPAPYRRFVSALTVAIAILTGRQILLEEITLCNNTVQTPSAEAEMVQQLFDARETELTHTPQSYEAGVLAAIENGDACALKRRLLEPVTGRIGQMSKNYLTQDKYIFVSFASLVTRAAIQGGLNAEVAFLLSDVYCQQMDEMTRPQDITVLAYDMALDFCDKVAGQASGVKFSPSVAQCCSFISQNLHHEIKLQDLAKATGLSARTVSIKFKEETGTPVWEHIHRQKMKEAKYLLKYSKNSIVDICSYLQYNSQSYFTKIFRDIYGKTPKQFRDEL